MSVKSEGNKHVVNVAAVSGTVWHLQFQQQRLPLAKGEVYTLTFTASADKPRTIAVGVGQAHEPWGSLGLGESIKLTKTPKTFTLGFIASGEDNNARVSFMLGDSVGPVTLEKIELRSGGVEGLRDSEDLTRGNIEIGGAGVVRTVPRREDWFRFLQHTDEKYFVGMHRFLKDELKLRAPVTGSIGWSVAGTSTQAKLDFVDGHAYWDHPHFPGKPWDSADWLIHNKPMVDRPEASALLGPAATRVEGKPYTVTEYNHGAPNEWAAECIPMIASYAAVQDWDGVFLFAYSHNNSFQKDHVDGFFDIEGDPLKLAQMPMGARIFMGVEPFKGRFFLPIRTSQLFALSDADDVDAWRTFKNVYNLDWEVTLSRRLSIEFADKNQGFSTEQDPDRLRWTAAKSAGSGRFVLNDPRGVAFTGFAAGKMPVALGIAEIREMKTPFASLILVPAGLGEKLAESKRLLLSAVARAANHDMKWNDARTSVSTNWGKGPVQIEPERAVLAIEGTWKVRALAPDGTPAAEVPVTQDHGQTIVSLGETATLWYELLRQ
jgi:hypothetical protein